MDIAFVNLYIIGIASKHHDYRCLGIKERIVGNTNNPIAYIGWRLVDQESSYIDVV